MNYFRLSWLFPISFLSGAVGGCGMRVPEISEVWDGPNATKQIEFEIRRRIYCDLKDVAIDTKNWKVKNRDDKTGKVISESQLLPDEWGAEVTISLQVDEASALNPGIAFNTPLHAGVTNFAGEFETASTTALATRTYPFATTPQSYSLGLGGTLSSTATRIDKINAFWTMLYLRNPPTEGSICRGAKDPFLENPNDTPSSSSPFLLESDLKIKEWLEDSIRSQAYIPSNQVSSDESTDQTKKKDASSSKSDKGGSTFIPQQLQYEIKFIIVTSGNVTPTWKLVRISANIGNTPLFGTGRTRTHDLLITISPKKNTALHVAAQNAQAIAAQLTSLTLPP